jgi:hypothetical protein
VLWAFAGAQAHTCYSDFFWDAYKEVIPEEQHEATGKGEGETCRVELWIDTF